MEYEVIANVIDGSQNGLRWRVFRSSWAEWLLENFCRKPWMQIRGWICKQPPSWLFWYCALRTWHEVLSSLEGNAEIIFQPAKNYSSNSCNPIICPHVLWEFNARKRVQLLSSLLADLLKTLVLKHSCYLVRVLRSWTRNYSIVTYSHSISSIRIQIKVEESSNTFVCPILFWNSFVLQQCIE